MKCSFNIGILFSLSLIGLIQSYLGKEIYIKFISEHWFNIPWYLWLIPIFGFYIKKKVNDIYNDDLLKLILSNKIEIDYDDVLSIPKEPEEGKIYTDVKGNEYVFENDCWKTIKNMKEELSNIEL
jgi:hypothetical protein